ncbi:MAG: hypothetical protein RL885_04835 [Planctomycetota bacterium]
MEAYEQLGIKVKTSANAASHWRAPRSFEIAINGPSIIHPEWTIGLAGILISTQEVELDRIRSRIRA